MKKKAREIRNRKGGRKSEGATLEMFERMRPSERNCSRSSRKKETGLPYGEERERERLSAIPGDENTVAPIPRKLSHKLSRKRPFSRAHRALAAPRMHVQLGRVPRGIWSEWLGRESRSRSGELASCRALSLADGWKLRMIAGVARA